jgi:hypothetical protein
MNISIDLSEPKAAAPEARAQAADVPTERCLAQMAERALDEPQRRDAAADGAAFANHMSVGKSWTSR